jgi:hypothetical protein
LAPKVAVGVHTRDETPKLSEAASMDIFKNPDEVIKEVEDDEGRRERDIDTKRELDESPEDQQPDKDLDDGED